MLIFIRLYATYMESLRPFRSFATVVCQMMGEDLYDLSPEVLLVVSGIFQRQLFVVGTRVQTTSSWLRPGREYGVPRGYPELGAKVYSIYLHFIRRSHEKSGWWGLPKGDPPWPHVSQVRDGGWKWGIQMAHFHRNMTVKTPWISGGFQFLDFFHVFFFDKPIYFMTHAQ